MARGDYIKVVYKTGPTVGEVEIEAKGVGGSVKTPEPRRDDLFVVVEELARNGEPVLTARFAKSEVVALIGGHRSAAERSKKR